MSGIYIIRNKINKFIYIGSTLNLNKRRGKHFRLLNSGEHYNRRMQEDYKTYGVSNFEFIILLRTPSDVELLRMIEQEFLDEHFGESYCYNLHDKAKGGAKSGVDNHMFGKTHSEETKKFLSEINSGENNPWYGNKEHMNKMRSKITTRFDGHKHTDETKRKMSEKRKGRKHSDETKRKISEANRNRVNQGTEKRKKRVSVDGVIYSSITEASRATGIGEKTLSYRLSSKNFDNCYFV